MELECARRILYVTNSHKALIVLKISM